jgi:SAM-dependent methyltransferase
MNMQKAEELAFRVMNDYGGAFLMALGYIGDRLGLFKSLEASGPVTSIELATATGLNDRYVLEWLKAMVAAEYIEFDPETGRYFMTPDQAAVLSSKDSPFYSAGLFQLTMPTLYNVPRITESFRNGGGIPYNEIGHEVPCAIEQVFRPGYLHLLVADWLAKVPGLIERLREGINVADVGCGRGQSTAAMARAFPNSRFTGVDYHADSIAGARELARRENLGNVLFVAAPAEQALANNRYSLITAFDCIHDMVDPVAALRTIHRALSPDGIFLWGEPNASHQPHENRNPIGRLFHAISPLHCLTVSLAHGGAGLGTVIGEAGARKLAAEAGFPTFEKLDINHPINQFFALRPTGTPAGEVQ